MLKVLIADDEKKVCKLIQMLCDWEKLGMELIGTAQNGQEAIEMIEKYRPDILITDICMPGYDGIDVIQKAKEMEINLQAMIISGYTDFKYAQSAIRYGVVEYLVKPIKKEELNASLQKLGERCLKEKERFDTNARLLQYMESDLQRKRYSLFMDRILKSPDDEMRLEDINEKYSYNFQPEVFRILNLKLDAKNRRISEQALNSVTEVLTEKMRNELSPSCEEFEIYTNESISYILCNYKRDNSHQFRQALRNAADMINLKRFQLGDIFYTIALGESTNDFNTLDLSAKSAKRAMRERLVEGCDKLLDMPNYTNNPAASEIVTSFNHTFDKAMELLDEALVANHISALQQTVKERKDLSGDDIIRMVNSIGIYGITVAQAAQTREMVFAFEKETEECYCIDVLFDHLKDVLCSLVRTKKELHQDEERKPVRLAKQYLINHYMEPVTLDLIANYVGFNSSYFSVIFKKEVGTGFGEYLTSLRIEKAKELLKNTKDNVKDICVSVGYNDLKHFNTVFKKATGLKPGEFRKLYG